MVWLREFPLLFILILVVTLGLAPYSSQLVISYMGGSAPIPEPHVIEKFRLLSLGRLDTPIDIFDLLMHLTPWVLLFAKLASFFVPKSAE